jgi:hypothetical protein
MGLFRKTYELRRRLCCLIVHIHENSIYRSLKYTYVPEQRINVENPCETLEHRSRGRDNSPISLRGRGENYSQNQNGETRFGVDQLHLPDIRARKKIRMGNWFDPSFSNTSEPRLQ